MEEKQKSLSPPPCPSTVTVRRNPPRRARATPFTTTTKPPLSSLACAKPHDVPTFPIDEILSIQIPQSEPKPAIAESLKIFLRIKPLRTFTKVTTTTKSRPRNVWPQNPSKKNNAKENRNPEITKKVRKKDEEACITLNDSYSVTLTPPQSLQELKRSKTEVYEGFSHVFPADCSQNDVYDKMVQPLLEDFMKGKSGMLAALGPSGSGKTHTVFGSLKDPGIVPITLRQIFKKNDESCSGSLRSFNLSIFEICSERGKGEKAYDLLGGESSELSVQQSTIRGLKEVPIQNLEEAESLIGQAMLKRATATTNSNSQSSRSQCIINIRASCNGFSNETKLQSSDAMLTIVDLAGAEREKRTGNQGERLVESNFINNTSMVFGQCLRSLLEYQKNRKKGLQKHHQNSLLTRYLRDYLEGKKRMALILTVKAGEEDYLDTSYLLRQASPYMKIKFDNTEEPCNKRQLKTFPRAEKNKKIKLSAPKTSQIEENFQGERCQISQEVNLQGKKADPTDRSSPRLEHVAQDKNEREHIIMRNFSKVLWNVLKQCNEKLKVAEGEIFTLKDSLRREQLKSLGLETELISLKSSCLAQPCIPEVEVIVNAKEHFEVDAALTNERNVDDDSCNLIKARREAGAEESSETPVPKVRNVDDDSCNLIKARREAGAEESSESPVLSVLRNVDDDSCNLIEARREAGSEESSKSPVPNVRNVDVDSCNLINPRREASTEESSESPVLSKNVKDAELVPCHLSSENDAEPRQSVNSEENVGIPSTITHVEAEVTDFQRDQAIQNQDDPTPSPEQVEVSQDCINSGLSNVQTKSAISRRFPDSEKQERNRRLLPASSRSLTEEMNDLEIKDIQTEKQQVKTTNTRVQKKAVSIQGQETEVPPREAEPASTKKQKNGQKPKRRLQPASSVLLTREINTLEIEDDIAEPKVNRGGKKTTVSQPRSQGSVTLLRLLTNNLHL
ncbi:ATP binding microtubule motor family protein [Arabidopsis thaliana]|uniref:Kinesin-like protein n=1 Tax=Arabidopsis thaliana TaxID=3702 RepID=A0A1P8ATR5_ARATH|nr:ATP binding microtubule motor family protein [Arabidopsis thaliana]ANM60020.1 ATP binding microtubule motor family protein [Arabidopsis thaliana]|eukprot:NP_001322333.1 ATP binding microtubule motor family protein [Arabidopsis thaliana]